MRVMKIRTMLLVSALAVTLVLCAASLATHRNRIAMPVVVATPLNFLPRSFNSPAGKYLVQVKMTQPVQQRFLIESRTTLTPESGINVPGLSATAGKALIDDRPGMVH